MEKLCLGLLYMFISCGTTIGSPNCHVNSAIFFTSDELTKQWIQNLTTTATGDICLKIKLREKCVNYLQKNKLQLQIEPHEKMELIPWASTTTVLKQTLEQLIKDTEWRQCNTTNF
jgi:hypothetical protein